MHDRLTIYRLAAPTLLALAMVGPGAAAALPVADTVPVRLTEWAVIAPTNSAPGRITFAVTNAGTIPHGFEVEGRGIEKRIALLQPGATGYLTVTLRDGRYELYCPVGGDSHKQLGMESYLTIGADTKEGARKGKPMGGTGGAQAPSHGIAVTGGGPVIQILPGPFPFPDSAAPILAAFGAEREGLESQVKMGPYSNDVASSSGTFAFKAWDLGAVRDSVDGTAEFVTADGARWKLVLDRVQTKDVPHHPRFGGVILGLYYHGNTGVHTPLVPTIRSAVALWAFGRLYRNDTLVTDNAQVHVMLLSRTRRPGTFALECWDCSKNPIEELQLQILPGTGEPKFDAPGGFLFLNWEKSAGHAL